MPDPRIRRPVSRAMMVDMGRAIRFPIRRYASPQAMKADEYAYWQGRPAHERLQAAGELSVEAYCLESPSLDALRLQRTLVHLKRAADQIS